MSYFFEALKQPEYLHVLLNHLPITGLAAAALGLFISLLFLRNREATVVTLILVCLFSLSAWPVVVTGDKGYDDVYALTDEDGESYLDHHMKMGERWSKLFYVTSAFAVVALVLCWKQLSYDVLTSWITLVLAVASIVAGAMIAESGGKVRHLEFRKGKSWQNSASPMKVNP